MATRPIMPNGSAIVVNVDSRGVFSRNHDHCWKTRVCTRSCNRNQNRYSYVLVVVNFPESEKLLIYLFLTMLTIVTIVNMTS